MDTALTIKLANDADRDRLRTLAQLDGKPIPQGDVLLAEVNGRLLAAVAMDGAVIADPFARTGAAVDVLRTQIAGDRPRRPRRWLARLLPV